MKKQYTIQEIRDLLVDLAEVMNPYDYIDAAYGIKVVHQFLENLQTAQEEE